MTATRHHGAMIEEGLSPVCSKPVMASAPADPFLLTLPGTTFSDRVYWTGEKVVIGSRNFVELEVCLLLLPQGERRWRVVGGGGW